MQDWGGDAQATLAMASRRDSRGFEQLLAAHQAAWHELWQSDILVDGDPHAQQALHSDLYYLLSNSDGRTRPGPWAPASHAQLRLPRLLGQRLLGVSGAAAPAPGARQAHRDVQASHHGSGARARPAVRGQGHHVPVGSGSRDRRRPHAIFAYGVYREIHVNADIAIAQWQYYLATGDEAGSKSYGWPVIREIAEFRVSRVDVQQGEEPLRDPPRDLAR